MGLADLAGSHTHHVCGAGHSRSHLAQCRVLATSPCSAAPAEAGARKTPSHMHNGICSGSERRPGASAVDAQELRAPVEVQVQVQPALVFDLFADDEDDSRLARIERRLESLESILKHAPILQPVRVANVHMDPAASYAHGPAAVMHTGPDCGAGPLQREHRTLATA